MRRRQNSLSDQCQQKFDQHDFKNAYDELHQKMRDLTQKHNTLVNKYNDLLDQFNSGKQERLQLLEKYNKEKQDHLQLQRKQLAIAGALTVTEDERDTFFKNLRNMKEAIQRLVTTEAENESPHLDIQYVMRRLEESGLHRDFPIQGDLKHSLLTHYIESVVSAILVKHLFEKPLRCFFDQGDKFEEICDWVEAQGSQAATRWRQELCIMLDFKGKAMAERREKEIRVVAMRLEALLHQVYPNADQTAMSHEIMRLCTMAFDLSFAMFGRETKIYVDSVKPGDTFNRNSMELAFRSGSSNSVALVLFPPFQDGTTYFAKSKVWCP